jgi:unsaturated rhamnogalacturonyl hydrolase
MLCDFDILDPDSYPGGEVSGSGFLTYALAWGINNGLLDSEIFLPVAKSAWLGLDCVLKTNKDS